MKKDTMVYIAIGGGLILLYLLWRKRNTEKAPSIMNEIANPNSNTVYVPVLQAKTEGNCGCNPSASNMLNGSLEAFKQAENNIEKQLRDYTNSINEYFATQFIQ